MTYPLILSMLIIGLSGLVAQVLLLRELLVSFYGNELTLGVVLANWVAIEALGVFLAGKLIDRLKNKINVFVLSQIIFSLFLFLSLYSARVFKIILGVTFGEAIGLSAIFFVTFFIILPVGFCHGALFSILCRIYSADPKKEGALYIGKLYSWETVGTIVGGIIFTYLFIPYLNSFQIVFIISIANLLTCLFFFKKLSSILKYTILLLVLLISALFFNRGLDYLHWRSIKTQWKNQNILDYQNSPYGNIAVTKEHEQYTFFYNGIPIITAPYPNISFVEEFSHLPLLFHQLPKDILVISAGAGGLINSILKHAVENIDYVEIDPTLVKMLKKYPTSLTRDELGNPRVGIINVDGRFFLKITSRQYDVILLGLSSQSDLSTNRLFTEDFFRLAKKRLKADGILAFWLSGSLTYLSQELKDLNQCILNGLRSNFDFVRVIPGDYNIYLASASEGITQVTSTLLAQRINQRNIETRLLKPTYLDYRLSSYWSNWFAKEMRLTTKKINQDSRPFAVYETLILWNKQFSPKLSSILGVFGNLNLAMIIIFVLFLTCLFLYIAYLRQDKKIAVAYSIATTGFLGMFSNLLLIFSFQVFYGYLYHMIGLLISVFMCGIALGSIFITNRITKVENAMKLFTGLETWLIFFSSALAWLLTKFVFINRYPYLIFIMLFFVCGMLIGMQFPLACRIYLKDKEQVGRTAGILYALDLMGGWFAGILGGIILLPVLGIFNSCIIIIIFKTSSFLLLLAAGKNGLTNAAI